MSLSEPGPSSSVPSVETDGDSAKTYCYCLGPEYGDVITQAVYMNGSTLAVCMKLVCQPKSKYCTVQTVENSPNSKERRVEIECIM